MYSWTTATFTCEKCGKQVHTDARKGNAVIPWFRKLNVNPDGTCAKCIGNVWTLTLAHSQFGTDDDHLAMEIGLALTTGIHYSRRSTASNSTSYQGIDAEFVKRVNEDPKNAMWLISKLGHSLERKQLKDKGARECIGCGAMYVVEPGKPWTDIGYCAKMCAIAHGEKSFVASLSECRTTAPQESNTIAVTCAKGHEFTVAKTFRGMKRPCPKCGEKVLVPVS